MQSKVTPFFQVLSLSAQWHSRHEQTALVLELRVEFGKALPYSTKEFMLDTAIITYWSLAKFVWLRWLHIGQVALLHV